MLLRLLPGIRFLRLPAVLTVPGDVWVGAALGGTGYSGSVLVSVGCAYLYGMALNDIVDEPDDRIHRPERPLPSGQIPKTGAVVLCLLLAILAFLVHPGKGLLLLLGWITAYTFLKNTHLLFAAFLMSACRCTVLWIGAGTPDRLTSLWPFFALWGGIILFITVLADQEGKPEVSGENGSLVLTGIFFFSPLLALYVGRPRFLLFLPWTLLAVLALQNYRKIRKQGHVTPANIGQWLSMLIPLQAVFLMSMAPAWKGLILLALWPCLRWSVRKMQIS